MVTFFFKKHRYAATGDADGEPISISRDEEFEKMERLEKEVLDYPGLVFPFLFFFSLKFVDFLLCFDIDSSRILIWFLGLKHASFHELFSFCWRIY